MADDPSSFMVTHFLIGIRHAMPVEHQAELEPYEAEAAVAGSDETAEWRRAYECAKWAQRTVSLPEHNGFLAVAEVALQIVRDVEKAIGGELTNLVEIPMGIGVSPKFEVELSWVYEAVRVAEQVADKAGWGAVPWQELAQRMLDIGAPSA